MIQIGPVPIHFYGIIIGIAILVLYSLVVKRAKLYDLNLLEFENFFFLLLPLSLIGARAYHVLDEWSYYQNRPTEIFAIWNGGLGWFGGLLGGFIALVIYAKIKHQTLLRLLDLFLPAISIAQAVGRWGNFVNQEAFGPPTDLPWGIFIKPENRPSVWTEYSRFHPTFLYESIPLLLIGIILLLIEKKEKRQNGQITAYYCILYGMIRFTTEFFRFDTATIGNYKTAQIVSIGLIVIGIIILLRINLWTILKKE